MPLVNDWRKAWTWHSMRASAFGFVLTSTAASLALAGGAAPWLSYLDTGIVLALAALIFLLSMAGRLISQQKGDDDAES